MRGIFLVLLLFSIITNSLNAVTIAEALYENALHFVITTRSATYWFDKAGGGIARMIDKSGNDWIAFKREPWNQVPGSAASSFRGIPNAVYQGSDSGCGHPGFDKCTSTYETPNTIRTKSLSGLWEWTWTFYEDSAVWQVERTDPTRRYWFLYEGPVGGSFSPQTSFWGNVSGFPLTDKPDHMGGEGVTGNWKWACFGRDDHNLVLAVVHASPDDEPDWFSYMGNTSKGLSSPDGMVVFGFGRTSDSKPMLKGNHKFMILFINRGDISLKEMNQGFLSKW